MKRLLLCLFLLNYSILHSQVITANDLVALSTLQGKRVNSYAAKLGFAQVARGLDDSTIINEFFYRNKKQPFDTTLRFISGSQRGKIMGVAYHTSSFSEYWSILRGFELNGFISGNQKDSMSAADSAQQVIKDSIAALDSVHIDTTSFLQKGEMTLRVGQEMRDEVLVYRLLLERKPTPTTSAVRSADDLLSFDSHQRLMAMFGPNNVKKDVYHFSTMDSARCSVIFPNSNRQAIFIWEDEENYRGLAFLMIGGGLHAESSNDFNESIALNTWRSSSGLYTGMRAQDIMRVNDADFNFFGINSEFAYMITPEKKGNIDFKQTGVVLGCFNCNGSPLLKKEKISAQAAMDAGLQLYIISMVFIPEK